MANFTPSPSRRLAYDRDDTIVLYYQTNDSGVFEFSQAQKDIINNEDDDHVSIKTEAIYAGETEARRVLVFMFPFAVQVLDIQLIYDQVTMTGDLEWSDDSTNGRDGTWTQEASSVTLNKMTTGIRPEYRNNIAAIGAAAAHKCWRFVFDPSGTSSYTVIKAAHVYAEELGPASRLSFWEPITDQELTPDPDFADNARGARYSKSFRVKNVSATEIANGVTLDVEQGPSFGRPDTWTLLSLDNENFSSSVNLGDIGPGSISGLVYWRCSPPVNAQMLTLSCRVTPSVTSWS